MTSVRDPAVEGNPALALAGVFLVLFAVLWGAMVTACPAKAHPSDTHIPDGFFEPGETVRVAAAVDGRTLALEDGRTVRLAGIDTPAFNGPDAATYLETMLVGQRVQLYYGGPRQDRWRRVVAHMMWENGAGEPLWVQGDLLTRGLARVFTMPDHYTGAAVMYELETSARAAGRGLWADDRFAVRTLPLQRNDLRSVQIVEGQVRDAAVVRGRVYLNFGPDWKTDFTVLIPSAVRRQMERAGGDLEALAGQSVRVRGWVKEWNGPMIEIDHGAQLEILEGFSESGFRSAE